MELQQSKIGNAYTLCMRSDPDKLISVAACASVAEATVLKTALEDHGIDAVLNGDSLNSAFGNVAPSLSDAQLLVRQEDAEEAAVIVRNTRDSFSAPRKDPWFCGKCLEEVEGGFEVCWSCGLARDETEAPFPATADVVEASNFPDVDTEGLGRTTDNPFESPRALGAAEEIDEEPDPDVLKAESKMTLAMLFAAACLWIPVLPAWAALFVILSARRKGLPIKGRAMAFLCVAIFLLVATHLVWWWIIAGRFAFN